MSDLKVIGTKHFTLEADNLEETMKELKKREVEFVTSPDITFSGGKYVFFKDCNGILIELYQR